MTSSTLSLDPPIAPASHGHTASLGALTVGALGVVFGDIGTSPLMPARIAWEGLET